MQDILNRLGLSVAYRTVGDVAYANITKAGTGEELAVLHTVRVHQIQYVVERFLEAFAQGYDRGYRDAKADTVIEEN